MLLRHGILEADVRDYMGRHGFVKESVRFASMELVGIARPGWVQVFKFQARATSDADEPQDIFGVVRDDERSGMRVFIGHASGEQLRVADEWSQGLITLQRKPLGIAQKLLLGLFIVSLAVASIAALLGPEP